MRGSQIIAALQGEGVADVNNYKNVVKFAEKAKEIIIEHVLSPYFKGTKPSTKYAYSKYSVNFFGYAANYRSKVDGQDIPCLMPIEFTAMNDRIGRMSKFLLTNIKHPQFIKWLEEFLEGYHIKFTTNLTIETMIKKPKIFVSQHLRRYYPGIEWELVKFINNKIQELQKED